MFHETLIDQVLQYAFLNRNERDCWRKAPVLTAALRVEKQPELVNQILARAVATQRSNGNLSYADRVDGVTAGHVRSFTPLASITSALGYPLLVSHQQRPNQAFLDAASRQVKALRAAPRTSDGGIWFREEGPELWVDATYLTCPFLALYGKLTGDAAAVDEAFFQYQVHIAHLLDPRKKLARHAWCEKPDHYPQSTFWSRGNGWLVCAGVDLLEIAPEHSGASLVKQTTIDALNAMRSYQDDSGYFCNVLDDPRSNLEASGTLMFAYAIAKAVRNGLLDADVLPKAKKAFEAVVGAVEPSGKVPGVAVPPGGPGVPFDWAMFGQGFFVLAAKALGDARA